MPFHDKALLKKEKGARREEYAIKACRKNI
jgi:hypothetical protein